MSGRVKVKYLAATDGVPEAYDCHLGGRSINPEKLPQRFQSRFLLVSEDNQLLAVFLFESAALEAADAINGADTPDAKLGRAARTILAAFKEVQP